MKNKFDDILNQNVNNEKEDSSNQSNSETGINTNEAIKKIKRRKQEKVRSNVNKTKPKNRTSNPKENSNNTSADKGKDSSPKKENNSSKPKEKKHPKPKTQKKRAPKVKPKPKNDNVKPKVEQKPESDQEPKVEQGSKVETEPESKLEQKPVSKSEPKTEAKTETDIEEKEDVEENDSEESEGIAVPLDIDVDLEGNSNQDKESDDTNESAEESSDDNSDSESKEDKPSKKKGKMKATWTRLHSYITNKENENKLISFLLLVCVVTIISVTIASYVFDFSFDDQIEASSSELEKLFDVHKEENTVLMEKAVNEGLPVNHYVLLKNYKVDFNKKGYLFIEGVSTEASINSVKIYEVNGEDYPATAVISSWAIKPNDNVPLSQLEENEGTIKLAIETALFNKESEFYNNEDSMKEIVSFAVERIVGEKLNVSLVKMEGDFK